MPIELPLKEMTREEKLRVMETLWEDLSRDDTEFESPDWHAEILSQTEQAVKEGKASFSDWEEAKLRIWGKAAKLP